MNFPPFALLMVVLTSAPIARAETPPPLTAAVLDFKEAGDDLAGAGVSVSTLLQVRLGSDSDSPLVERAELNAILREQELTVTDSLSAGQAARLGELIGAEVIISGRVFAIDNRVHVVAKMISSSTGRVFGATAEYERQGEIDDAVSNLSLQIAKILKEKHAQLAAGKPLKERTSEKISALMKDRKAPKICVSIKELVRDMPTPDPAAQAALCSVLEAAGWTVVASGKESDVMVTGKAFSETGVRRGNLRFIRARLEFTVHDASGEILESGRVVSGNVDINEAVGHKNALQKSGMLAAVGVARIWATTENHP